MSRDADLRGKLKDAFNTPATKYHYVRQLFATIADRYDLITRLLSFGQDQRWKKRLIRLSGVTAGDRLLDVACGTGDIALLGVDRGARVIGLDVTHRMLCLAREKVGAADAVWVAGDMASMPVADSVMDVVTTGYGLRNVPDLGGSLAEIYRVLRPGGLFISLDFNRPVFLPVRAIYLTYLSVVGSILGILLHGNSDIYRYIPASIRRYPGAEGVKTLMRSAGFQDVRHLRVLAGLMAIHMGTRPGETSIDRLPIE